MYEKSLAIAVTGDGIGRQWASCTGTLGLHVCPREGRRGRSKCTGRAWRLAKEMASGAKRAGGGRTDARHGGAAVPCASAASSDLLRGCACRRTCCWRAKQTARASFRQRRCSRFRWQREPRTRMLSCCQSGLGEMSREGAFELSRNVSSAGTVPRSPSSETILSDHKTAILMAALYLGANWTVRAAGLRCG